MMKSNKLLLLLPFLLLSACSDNDKRSSGPEFKDAAIVAGRAPDYSVGAVSVVDTASPFAASNNHAETISDIFVRSGGDHYFLISRYGTDQISRFNPGAPDLPVYTYSTLDAEDTASSNPSDLIIANETKAYLLRYGSGKLWVVNPSATSETTFKIDEIDLSDYDIDGLPDMEAGVIKDGKLYVVLQRLESYNAVKNGYVAVIDVATNEEIDTQPDQDGLKGIELPVQNPSNISVIPGTDKLLVTAWGDAGSWPDYVATYTGGLATIDTGTQTASVLLDDGTPETHPFNVFINAAVVSATRGYFISTTNTGSDGVQTLYRFNPSDADATPVAVAGLLDKQLGALAVDAEGKLWISRTDDATPGLTVLGFAGGTETVEAPLIDTDLTPINIDFVTLPVN